VAGTGQFADQLANFVTSVFNQVPHLPPPLMPLMPEIVALIMALVHSRSYYHGQVITLLERFSLHVFSAKIRLRFRLLAGHL
jgi:hypothetical protein